MELTLDILKEWLKDCLEIKISTEEYRFEDTKRINIDLLIEGETICSDSFDVKQEY